MITYKKIDGEIFISDSDEDNNISRTKDGRIKILENLINYNEVNKEKYRLSSITMTEIINSMSNDDVSVIYNDIIKCNTREDLIEILYKAFNLGTKGSMRNTRVNAWKNEINYSYTCSNIKSNIEKSIDTSLACLVSKVISDYYRNIIFYLRDNNNEVFEELKLLYLKDRDSLESILMEIKEVSDHSIKEHIFTSIRRIMKLQLTKTKSDHLCSYCELGYTDLCPKIKASWPKHIKDFPFITDGEEVVYENVEEKIKDNAYGSKKESNTEDNDNEELNLNDMVKSLMVSKCILQEIAKENDFRREKVYNSDNSKILKLLKKEYSKRLRKDN